MGTATREPTLIRDPELAAAEWEPSTHNHDPQHIAFARECYAAGYAAAMADATSEKIPVVEKNVMLADLAESALRSNLTGLRFVLVDALNVCGPAWHTFRSPVRIRGIDFRPGDSGLLVAIGRKVEAFRPGFIPSWVKRTGPDWDQSNRVVLPARLRDRFLIRSTQNDRPSRRPVVCGRSTVQPPWE